MNLRNNYSLSVTLLFSAAALSFATDHPASKVLSEGAKARALANYGKLPLSFEENHGQADAPVKFLSQGNGYTLMLSPGAVEVNMAQPQSGRLAAIRMSFPGAQPSAALSGDGRQATVSSYFIGNDPAKWVSGAPNYSRVRYHELYPGVDVVFYGNQRQLEYDMVVAPGADPKTIHMQFDGAASLRLDGAGNLVLGSAAGEMRQHRPVVYQERDGVRHSVSGRYVLQAHNRVAFEVGQYDSRRPLIIDPTFSFATYLGTPGEDLFGLSATADSATYPAVAVDAQGNVYLTGFNGGTASQFHSAVTLPAPAGGAGGGGSEVFVVKMNSTGTALTYSVVFGGGQTDVGGGIAVDSSGNAYVTGFTSSTNFPVSAGAAQNMINGGTNAFVTKVNSAGNALTYSTYLGGNGSDWGRAIAVDPSGNAHVTGTAQESAGTNFPLVSPLSATPSAGFLTEVNSTGTAFVYSTFLSAGIGYGIAVDPSGDSYVTGSTGNSTTPSPSKAYVMKVNPTGSSILYGPVYLGAAAAGLQSIGFGIALDAQGDAYVAGMTNDTHFPVTESAAQSTYGGGLTDAFAAKLGPSGAIVYATYIGGVNSNQLPERASGIGVDGHGNAYISGTTECIDFPVIDQITGAHNGSPAILYKGSVSGFTSTWTPTSLAGSFDEVTAIAIDPSGNIYAGASALNVTPGGGIFKSTNGGTSWTQLTGGPVDAIAVDPANAAILYAVASQHIYQSTNSGGTWSLVGPAVGTAGSVAISLNGSTIYVGSSTGLIYSSNAGVSWTTASTVPPPVTSVVADRNNTLIAYAASGSGVYRSLTNGGSWASTTSPTSVTSLAVNSSSTLYAASGSGLYYLLNGSSTWTQISESILAIPSTPLLVAVDGGNHVYLAFEGSGLAVGINGGTVSGDWSPLTYGGLTQNQILALAVPPGVVATCDTPDGCGAGTPLVGMVAATDAFLTTLSSDGSTFTSSTCIGGSDNDLGQNIAVTSSGSVYLSGVTASTNFPATGGAVQTTNAGLYDVFAVALPGSVGGGSAPTVVIEEPLPGTILDGTVTVTGWALDTGTGGTAISSVQILIDGTFVANATYGTAMNLCGSYPSAPGCANAGFTYQFASSSLAPGTHTVTALASDSGAPANVESTSVDVSIKSGPVIPFDFDSNIAGGPDVIWEDPVSGFAQVWYLGGTQGISILSAANLTLSNPWRIVGVADFDGNGTPDVLWQDPVAGSVQIWYMGGTMGNEVMTAATLTGPNPWRVVSVGDFNKDGHPDLLWEDTTTGFAQIWYMGGSQGLTLLNAANLNVSNPWHIVGSGDFNGDGIPDVLWQDPVSGTVQIWYMGGALGNVVQSAVNLTANPWHVVAIADYNLDGHPDVVFQDPVSNSAQVFFYNGSEGTNLLTTGVLSGPNPWYIAGPH